MKKNILERFSDFADLPKDVTMGLAKVTFIGNRNLRVDNYRGLVEYTTKKIELNAKNMYIEITGDELNIIRIEADVIFIEGEIKNTEFVYKNKAHKKRDTVGDEG